jgi:hypothetical protein
VARPKKRPAQAELLTQAAEKLANVGMPEHADAIREALTELTRPKAREGNPTLTVWTTPEIWRAAQEAGSVPDLIEEGFAALLAGRFKPAKARRTTGGPAKGSFSARATVDRQREVTDYVAAHADTLGWSPSARQVAAAWLEHKFSPRPRT